MNLEQIAADAEICAENFWWEVHDGGDYDETAKRFAKQEEIIAKYAGNKPDLDSAKTYFSTALQAYDTFAYNLANGHAQDRRFILTNLEKMYESLGTKDKFEGEESIAQHNYEWWTSFAMARLDAKRDRPNGNRTALVFQSLTGEHKQRYGFSNDVSVGLASLVMAAAYLGHNTRDWKKTEGLLKTYYTELFSALSQRI